MKLLPIKSFEEALKERLTSSDRIKDLGWELKDQTIQKIAPVVLERIEVYGDIDALVLERDLDFYFAEPSYDALSLKWKDENDLISAEKHLSAVRTIIQGLSGDWTEDTIKNAVWPYADKEGRGAVLWPFRYSLSGKDKSPNPFTLASILGKEITLKRLEEGLRKCVEFNSTSHKWDNTLESPTSEQ